MSQEDRVIVIGGGLAGLMAALTAARAGRTTLVLEQTEALGGKAQTQEWKGFRLNLGAHALFKGGKGYMLLREQGLLPEDAQVHPRGRTLWEGHLDLLPSGPFSMLATGLLGWKEKGTFLALMSRLPKVDLEEASKLTCTQWLECNVENPRVRQIMGAILRTSVYGGDPNRVRASLALRRVLESQKGVIYLHDGWGALVQRLFQAAQAAGVMFQTSAAVSAVRPRSDGFEVRVNRGEVVQAQEVILALPPSQALGVLPEAASVRLQNILGDVRPVTAACLDLCLSWLPKRAVNTGLGIDEPLFMVAQSETVRIAPEGAALVHLLNYHEGHPSEEPSAMRSRLESFMDRLQPGWRNVLLHARFLPNAPIASVQDEPGRRHPVSEDLGMQGLYLAGDWVGEEGWLADASIASGYRAGLSAATMAACA